MSTVSRRRLAAGSAALLAFAGVAVTAQTTPAHPDAALLDLGAKLEAAWAVQSAWFATHQNAPDAEINAATAPCGAIVECIEHTPARTIAGLHVKARALVWCQDEEANIGPDMFNFTLGDTTTDLRLGASIVADLLAIGEARI